MRCRHDAPPLQSLRSLPQPRRRSCRGSAFSNAADLRRLWHTARPLISFVARVMEIADQRVAYLHFVLTDDKGEVLDRSAPDQPLAYLHGSGNIIPGLEKALAGRVKGDKLDVTVPPEEAYGMRSDDMTQTLPRRMFKGIPDLQVGMRLHAQSDHGPQVVTVTRIAGD